MNDCPNADVRDLLPDLMHERLDPSTRAMVESHIEGCADCQAEFALLRDLHVSLRRTPALDIAAISAAVPAYRAPVRRSWVGWRTAAAITVLVAGGSSVALLQRNVSPNVGMDPVAEVPVPVAPVPAQSRSGALATRPEPMTPTPSTVRGSTPAISAPVTAPAQPLSSAVQGGRELAMAGGTLTDLSDKELASLLKEIEKLDAVPSTDVESGAISPAVPPRGTP